MKKVPLPQRTQSLPISRLMPKPLRNSRFSRAIRSRKRDRGVNFFSVSFVLNALQHVTTSGSPQQETLRQNQGRVLRTAAFLKGIRP
jgi:hypothetical protein